MIDRYHLVTRHNPVLKKAELDSPLTVGNGEFAFTVDITGLQSFPELYKKFPLCTLAQWGWHSFIDCNYDRKALKLTKYRANGREIPYPSQREGQEGLFDYLRQNPHKFHLGQLGLHLLDKKGRKASIDQLEDIEQTLNLWEGSILSKFKLSGVPVTVETICHPRRDLLAVSIESPLIKEERLFIDIRFPYPSSGISAADWNKPDKHRSNMLKNGQNKIDFSRVLDKQKYFAALYYPDGGVVVRRDKHYFQYQPQFRDKLSFTMEFSNSPLRNENLSFSETKNLSSKHWSDFWTDGGIIDFSGSSDSRARELERRIILSQYLTAIHCSGSYPPQETGLSCNSWYGKFHLEMHFWHALHFAFWGRAHLLRRSLWWYHHILAQAKELASSQGFRGARWPKMVGPDGFDSPSSIGPFLIWQQPHPIIYAEAIYKSQPEETVLHYFKDIVFNTAEFMVSFLEYDKQNRRYLLAAPLIPAQECHCPEEVSNPTFELEYWHFALRIAQKWRERLGLERKREWADVITKLAGAPIKDGVYLAHENCPETFTRKNYDHPSMLAAFGVLPGERIDKGVMLKTLKRCLDKWQFNRVWGWDFPMMAMTAARLGETELAVELLLMDSPVNKFLKNGHNRQGDKESLPLYLPGNGALLLATGMMAAGWDGAENRSLAGFPDNQSWSVKYEGISCYF